MLTPFEVLQLYPAHDRTLGGALASRAQTAGGREFLLFQGRSYSYAQVREEALRTAALLHARGVGPGMRVSVMSSNHPSTVFVLLALCHLGAVMVPINPDYGPNEAAYVLEHAQVCGVIASPEALPTVRAALEKLTPGPTPRACSSAAVRSASSRTCA